MTDEQAAVARLQHGDIGGLEWLVHHYQAQAVGAAYLICRDAPLAEDLVQAAFLRAYARIGQFDAARPFGPWFLRSVVNDALKAAARAARQQPLPAEDHQPDAAATAPDPLDLLLAAERATAIGAALDQLTPEARAALTLRYYLDLSEAEVAERLALPRSTVKWRLYAARQKLRHLLPAWLHPATDDPPEPPTS